MSMVLLSFLSSPAVVCCQVFWIKVRRRSCSLCFGEVRRQLFDRAPLGEDPHTRAPNKVTFVFLCWLRGRLSKQKPADEELHHPPSEQQRFEQKCLCDTAAQCTASSNLCLGFIWCQQQKIWSFQKNWQPTLPPLPSLEKTAPPPFPARSPSS